MKRSAALQRRTPLARTGFKRKESKPFALADRKTIERHAEMKRRVKRVTVAEGKRFIHACRGEECYLRVSGICQAFGWGNETVVPCHSNQARHGKAGAMKAEHRYTVPGCAACHAYIDQGSAPRAEKFGIWDRAFERWEPVRARKLGITQPEMEIA